MRLLTIVAAGLALTACASDTRITRCTPFVATFVSLDTGESAPAVNYDRCLLVSDERECWTTIVKPNDLSLHGRLNSRGNPVKPAIYQLGEWRTGAGGACPSPPNFEFAGRMDYRSGEALPSARGNTP